MCAYVSYDLRSGVGSESGSESVTSGGSSSSGSKYKYRGKYRNINRKKLVRCSAITLSGKRCSRKCEKDVCYQHSVEYKLEQVQKSMVYKDKKILELEMSVMALIKRVQELELKDKKTTVAPDIKEQYKKPILQKQKSSFCVNIITYFFILMMCFLSFDLEVNETNTFMNQTLLTNF